MTLREQIIQSGDRLYLVEWWELGACELPIIIRATSEHGEVIDCQDHPGIKADLLQIINLTPVGQSPALTKQPKRNHERLI